MQKKSPAFAILRVEVQRFSDLMAVHGHNARKFAVQGIDPESKGHVKELLLKGPDLCQAVAARISQAGIEKTSERRIVAAEILLTCSPDADPMPPPELMASRGLAFAMRAFGEENVVAAWQHDDEKTSHLHVVVVPICRGVTPGRPCGGDGPDKAQAEPLVVSWSQLSGAYDVDDREDDTRRRRRKKGSIEKTRRNRVMAGWQTEWALEWVDFGLRRGAPSTRSHLPIRWIRGEHQKIAEQSESTMRAVHEAIAGFQLTPNELAEFLRRPSPVLVQRALADRLNPLVENALAPMTELAARGIQLDAERRARADLADAHEVLQHQLAAAPSAEEFRRLEEANSTLQEDVVRLQQAVAAKEKFDGCAYLAGLSDEAFEVLVNEESRRRQTNEPAPAVAPVQLRSLPVPKIGPEPSSGGPAH
jgi:Plasmid recombination enzyme